MQKHTNSRDIPQTDAEYRAAAQSLLDCIRPMGWPIAVVRRVLSIATDLLEQEPVRNPAPRYQKYVDDM